MVQNPNCRAKTAIRPCTKLKDSRCRDSPSMPNNGAIACTGRAIAHREQPGRARCDSAQSRAHAIAHQLSGGYTAGTRKRNAIVRPQRQTQRKMDPQDPIGTHLASGHGGLECSAEEGGHCAMLQRYQLFRECSRCSPRYLRFARPRTTGEGIWGQA